MPGISMRKMRRSPMRTVSTSRWVLGSMMRMRGGGAAGADVMLVTKKKRSLIRAFKLRFDYFLGA